MISISGFCKFLWCGSVNSDLEQIIKAPVVKGPDIKPMNSTEKTAKFIKTTFTHDDHYSLMDFQQLQIVAAGTNQIKSNLISHYDSFTIHDQVKLTCPDTQHYADQYKQLAKWSSIGRVIAGTVTITSIIFAALSKIKNKPVFAIYSGGVAALSTLFFGALSQRRAEATFFLDRIKDITSNDFFDYRRDVMTTRASLYQNGLGFNVSNATKQVVSPSEIEVLQLFRVYQESRKEGVFIEEVFSGNYSAGNPAVTPELKAINTYLEEVTSSKWISTIVEAFITEIKRKSWAGRAGCVEALAKIPALYSTKECLRVLDKKNQENVIGHLRTYLEARYQREEGMLPTGNQLTDDLIKSTKEKVRLSILDIINKKAIPYKELDNSFWPTVGLKPDFSWAD